eukprot:g20922.t1
MVWVTVHFAAEGERWTHDFEVPQDAQVRELKATMLNPPGTDEERSRGMAPDRPFPTASPRAARSRGGRRRHRSCQRRWAQKIIIERAIKTLGDFVSAHVSEDCDLDFEFLGPVEGERKARRDKADEPHWAALQLPQQEQFHLVPEAGGAPMKPKTSSVEVAVEAIRAQPAKRPPHATEKGPMSPVKRWEVIGGADKGGILVREGQSTTSKQLAERLSTGAFVEELDLRGERLNYKRLTGTGPEIGWVSWGLSCVSWVLQDDINMGFGFGSMA